MMRRGGASLFIFVLLVSAIGDLAVRSQAAACQVAPCCAGKTVKSCPMHRSDGGATSMRSCSSPDRDAVLTLAVLATPSLLVSDRRVAQPIVANAEIIIEGLIAAPITPPPRHV